jgi:hypothetical protein
MAIVDDEVMLGGQQDLNFSGAGLSSYNVDGI